MHGKHAKYIYVITLIATLSHYLHPPPSLSLWPRCRYTSRPEEISHQSEQAQEKTIIEEVTSQRRRVSVPAPPHSSITRRCLITGSIASTDVREQSNYDERILTAHQPMMCPSRRLSSDPRRHEAPLSPCPLRPPPVTSYLDGTTSRG